MNFENVPWIANSAEQFSASTWGSQGSKTNKYNPSLTHCLSLMQINDRSIKLSSKSLSPSSCLSDCFFQTVSFRLCLSDCFLPKNIFSVCQSGFMYCLAFSWLCIVCLLPCLFFSLYSNNTVLVNKGTSPKATANDISPGPSLRGHFSPSWGTSDTQNDSKNQRQSEL